MYSNLSKAFDTLFHDVFIYKLRYYGVNEIELNFQQAINKQNVVCRTQKSSM